MTGRPIHLGFSYSPHGAHPGGWRHPEGRYDPFDPAQITALLQLAEEAGFTFARFADNLAPDPRAGAADPDALARTEVFTTASFLATRTRRLGFVVTGDTSYFEPFNLARLTSSLDHVTHGRGGWEIATGARRPAARNYSRAELSADEHLARAAEVADILRKLWDSWEDEAFIRNKATGEYVDGDKIHPINHEGERFRIKGPLNVARPPQGQLVVAYELASDADIELAATQADLVFLGDHPADELKRRLGALHRALAGAGRSADQVRTFAEITPVIAATSGEAQALLDDLNARAGQAATGTFVVGGPAEVADQIEALVESVGVDGVLIRPVLLPQQLAGFADLVSPELRRRGLLADLRDGDTLRDHFGLARPANRNAA